MASHQDNPHGATPLTDLSGLKIKARGKITRAALYEREAVNVTKAFLKYLTTNKRLPLTYGLLVQLHKDMFGDVWSWAGKIRTTELNIGLPPHHIITALGEALQNIRFWEEHTTFETVEIATRLHHKAVEIHPFLNGNGRWARLLTNIYLKNHGLPIVSWDESNLQEPSDLREIYLAALRSADHGDFHSLTLLHKI